MTLICIKLCSGEELIGESVVDKHTEYTYHVKNVRTLELVDSDDGWVVSMLPYALGNINVGLDIELDKIVATYFPSTSIESEYLKEVMSEHISASFGV